MSKLFDKALSLSENLGIIKKRAIKAFSGSEVDSNTRLIDNIICFVGASGGVGTTTLVANLGYLLMKAGLSVAIVDLNLEYPNLHTLYGVKTKLKQLDLVTFLNGRNELGSSIVFAEKVALLFPVNRNMLDKINTDKETHSKNLSEGLIRLGRLFDIVLVDCNRDIGFELVNSAMYVSDRIYCVMDDGISSISNYDRLIRNMSITGIDVNKVSIVMNKRTSVFYYNNVLRELETGEEPVMIPFDLGVIESGLRGELFCKSGASGKTGDLFNEELDRFMHQLIESSGMYISSRPKHNIANIANILKGKSSVDLLGDSVDNEAIALDNASSDLGFGEEAMDDSFV